MNRNPAFLLLFLAAFAVSMTACAAPPAGEPVFTTVFRRGKGPYPVYRIPSLVSTKKGTLLAFAEGRRSLSDHSRNDIVLRRSDDGGKSWGPPIRVLADKDAVFVNPCAVVLDSGRVLLMCQRFPVGYHSRAMGKRVKRLDPGIGGKHASKTLLTYSDDEGRTWAPPRDVTKGTKRPKKITSTASGPGIGIVLRKGPRPGRILVPTNEGWFEGKTFCFNVYACFSDDGGLTWKYGKTAPNGSPGFGNEVQMVELSDGRVMLNSRSAGGARCRKIAFSADAGVTWSPLKDEKQLPDPHCMASIFRYSFGKKRGDKGILLYAGPGTGRGRELGTVRASFDDGRTWPVRKVIYRGGYAYSCLARLSDGSVGLLFEKDGYKEIAFARFGLDWLTSKEQERRK